MSLLDKVVSAVSATETDQQRLDARVKARGAAIDGDWLSLVLLHHQQIEAAFEAVKSAAESAARVAAQKRLAVLLTGHSIAEEVVLYPALVKSDEGHSAKAYSEQSDAKVQMSYLEDLAPMSEEYLDKLEGIRSAVAHHIYEEEGNWFFELKKKLPAAEQVKLTFRYREEFMRYTHGSDAMDPQGFRRLVSERSFNELR